MGGRNKVDLAHRFCVSSVYGSTCYTCSNGAKRDSEARKKKDSETVLNVSLVTGNKPRDTNIFI